MIQFTTLATVVRLDLLSKIEDRPHLLPSCGYHEQIAMEQAPVLTPPPRKKARWIWLLLGGVCAVILAFNAESLAHLRHQIFPKRFGVVEPGLVFRSGQISDRLIERVLTENRIEVVVDLTNDFPGDPHELADKQAELSAIQKLGIERRQHVLMSDGTGDLVVYAEAVKSVADAANAGKPVLVHCAAGTQRTGGVVALYRILVRHQSVDDAYAEMQEYKYNVRTSPRLHEFLNENMEELAALLVQNGTIDEIPQHLPKLP